MERRQVNYNRKTKIDKTVKIVLFILTTITSSIIVVSALFILFRGVQPFFKSYLVGDSYHRANFGYFLFGNFWEKGHLYGAGFILINTIYVSLLALLIATPISVLGALFITKMAPKKVKIFLESVIEILASIPSVIYGLFASVMITGFVKNLASVFNYQTAGGASSLAASFVLAIMIIPTITLLSIAAIKTVPETLEHASLALGASKTQTNYKIVLKASSSFIFQGVIVGLGRAFGEATAVSMVAGNTPTGPTFNIFDTTRTLTSTMLIGIHESHGMGYDIRFSVGILLMALILVSNLALTKIKERMQAWKRM